MFVNLYIPQLFILKLFLIYSFNKTLIMLFHTLTLTVKYLSNVKLPSLSVFKTITILNVKLFP